MISRHLNYEKQHLSDKLLHNKSTFNKEQLNIFNTIEKTIDNLPQLSHQPNLFFLGGCGGSGKTYLYNTILTKVRSENKIGIGLASSGIASLLIDDGHTAHSILKIPLQVNETTFCDIKPNSPLAELIKQTTIFVWDEAPMMSKDVYETVDRTFR